MKVHFVKSAAKDNRVVKKGESYYWWKFRHGGKRFSKTKPRQSQLTNSDKLSRVYAAQESIEDVTIPQSSDYDNPTDLADAVSEVATAWQDAADELRSVAEEYRESAENIREHFCESSTADECEEKADTLDSDADEAESKSSEIESLADSIRGIDYTPPKKPEEKAEGEETDEEENEDTESWRDEADSYLSDIPEELEVNI